MPPPGGGHWGIRSLTAVLLLYALTLFTGATLLFVMQPMVGKMILPLLGGTPAVWSTCMVFFQAALLGGYAYASSGDGVYVNLFVQGQGRVRTGNGVVELAQETAYPWAGAVQITIRSAPRTSSPAA